MTLLTAEGLSADDAGAAIREACAALERRYGNPRHGNLDEPLDELVYIILSTRTRDVVFRRTFDALKRAFPSWEQVTAGRLPEIESILTPSGLGRLKARQIVAILDRLRSAFGNATLSGRPSMV